jgi:hypothetical protein
MDEMKTTRANLVNVSLSLSTVTSLCFGVTAALRAFRECRMARNGRHQGIT